jgi:hypothetical protein
MNDDLFSDSPFAITASPATAACWAGRPETIEKLKHLQSIFDRRPDSSLDLMWANLGAGKSHVLNHLAYRLRTPTNASTSVPVVIEMPEKIKTFLDLYTRITSAIPTDRLAEAMVSVTPGPGSNDLKQAGNVLLNGGPEEKSIAQEWVTGGRPHLRDLGNVTRITRKIQDDIAATDALCGILTGLAAKKTRLVIMIDEFQRISVLKPQARDTLLSSLRSVFSRTPKFLSVIIAAAYRVERNALDSLSPELKTLLGRPSISLPEFNEAEALDFVRERFAFFRPPNFSGAPLAPFTEHGVSSVLETIKTKSRPLIPREILHRLAFCCDASPETAQGLGPAECASLLEAATWEEA